MSAASLLPHPDGRQFEPVEIELIIDGDAANDLDQLTCTEFGLDVRPPYYLRRHDNQGPAGAGSSIASAGADPAAAAPQQYRFVLVSSATAAQHILEYSSIMDPDNAAVDGRGQPAVWVRIPQPAHPRSTPAAAAAAPAAAGSGVTPAADAQQQQSSSGSKQATSKECSGSRKHAWQALARDLAAEALLRIFDKDIGRVVIVTPDTKFEVSAEDGELTVSMHMCADGHGHAPLLAHLPEAHFRPLRSRFMAWLAPQHIHDTPALPQQHCTVSACTAAAANMTPEQVALLEGGRREASRQVLDAIIKNVLNAYDKHTDTDGTEFERTDSRVRHYITQ